MSSSNNLYQKSLLNTYTNTSQTVTTGANIRFDNINVLDGCSIDFNAGTTSITLEKAGVYLVTIDATVSDAGTPGSVGLQINRNGAGVNGATSRVVTTASTDVYPLGVSTLVKVLPSCCAVDNTTVLTISNIGLSAIYANANLTVVKLC